MGGWPKPMGGCQESVVRLHPGALGQTAPNSFLDYRLKGLDSHLGVREVLTNPKVKPRERDLFPLPAFPRSSLKLGCFIGSRRGGGVGGEFTRLLPCFSPPHRLHPCSTSRTKTVTVLLFQGKDKAEGGRGLGLGSVGGSGPGFCRGRPKPGEPGAA